MRNYPKTIRNLLSKKAAIWRVYRRNPNNATQLKYTEIANKCKLAILEFDKAREEKILQANNLGAFFKFVNAKLNSSSGIAPLLNPDGSFSTSDLDKAALLNKYFESVFTLDNGTLPHFPNRTGPDNPGIQDINISPSIIEQILNKTKKKFCTRS